MIRTCRVFKLTIKFSYNILCRFSGPVSYSKIAEAKKSPLSPILIFKFNVRHYRLNMEQDTSDQLTKCGTAN